MSRFSKFAGATVVAGLAAAFVAASAGAGAQTQTQAAGASVAAAQDQTPKAPSRPRHRRPGWPGTIDATKGQPVDPYGIPDNTGDEPVFAEVRNDNQYPIPPHCKQAYADLKRELTVRGMVFTGDKIMAHGNSAPNEDFVYQLFLYAKKDKAGNIPGPGANAEWMVVGVSLANQRDTSQRDGIDFVDISQDNGGGMNDSPMNRGNTIVPQGAACKIWHGNNGFPDRVEKSWWYKQYFEPVIGVPTNGPAAPKPKKGGGSPNP